MKIFNYKNILKSFLFVTAVFLASSIIASRSYAAPADMLGGSGSGANVGSVTSGSGGSSGSSVSNALRAKSSNFGAKAAPVFKSAGAKLAALFRNAKMITFIIGGFGLIGFAFLAIFGKVKWAWFASLAFGLAVVAAANGVIVYAVQDNNATDWADNIGADDTYK